MKETLIDIETYSEVDIGKCGLYRYATDPSFEILLVAWATDEGDGFGETDVQTLHRENRSRKSYWRISSLECAPDRPQCFL